MNETKSIVETMQVLTSTFSQNTSKQPTYVSIFNSSKLDETIKKGLDEPPLKLLFGDFIQNGELVIFFGDNGLGKSILAAQIAYGIANGKKILGLENECKPMTCLYYDFELMPRNYANRYHNKITDKTFVSFGDNFIRQQIDYEQIDIKKDFNDLIEQSFLSDINQYNAECIIIDNITAISLKSTSDNNEAINLMRRLDKIRKEKNVTMIILAHTPKVISGIPIKKEHLAGAKQLSDFADGLFSIGKSAKDEKLRYLIQLKSRNGETIYHSKNVLVCQIAQKDDGFLGFDLIGIDEEFKHLKDTQEVNKETIDKIKQLKKENLSLREIGKRVGKNKDFVKKILDE